MIIRAIEKKIGAQIASLSINFDQKVHKLTKGIEGVKTMVGGQERKLNVLTRRVDKVRADVNQDLVAALDEREEKMGDMIEEKVAEQTNEIRRELQEIKRKQRALEEGAGMGRGGVRGGTDDDDEDNENYPGLGKSTKQKGRRQMSGQGGDRPGGFRLEQSNKYWEARKSLRVSPIMGDNDEERLLELCNFAHNVLLIEDGDFDGGDVHQIRKIKTLRTAAIKNECIVIFKDTETRDFFLSHAKNLASARNADDNTKYNIRLEIPGHLMECFKTLDRHGHILKGIHGQDFRRHVKMDDQNESLYLDVRVKQGEQWERVYPEFAKSEREIRERRFASARRHRISSLRDDLPGNSQDRYGEGDKRSEEQTGDGDGTKKKKGGKHPRNGTYSSV